MTTNSFKKSLSLVRCPNWDALAEFDFFRSFEHGKSPEDLVEQLIALGELWGDAGLTFAAGAHLFGSQIVLESTPKLSPFNASVLDRARAGERFAHAITEPGAGSDIFSMSGRGFKLPDGRFRLKASKTYVSGASEAKWMLVYVMTDPGKKAFGGLSGFVLRKGEWEITSEFEKLGLDSCSLCSVEIDCSVPFDRLVGSAPGGGYQQFMHAMDWERIGLSAIHVGTMRKVLEKSKTYSKIRTQGGVSNSSHQTVAFQLADMAVATESSELMVRAAAANLKSSAKQRTLGASMCKLFVSESLVQQCRAAIQMHGGNGYIRGKGPEQWMRDALSSTIYSGTSEMQRGIIAGLL